MRVVSPAEVTQAEAQKALRDIGSSEEVVGSLAAHIRHQFDIARRHQESEGIRTAMVDALRTYRGQYSPEKLAEISQFQGSKVYARLTAVKCRGATAILRDIYLGATRPWALEATPEPSVPGDVMENVLKLISTEVQTLQLGGQPVDEAMIAERMRSLMDAANKAEKKNAKKEAEKATEFLDDLLTEGGFYQALNEALIDLPIYSIACIKGPVIRNHAQVTYQPDGSRIIAESPKMFWERVSPFDLYFSPGASRIEHASVIERIRIPLSSLQSLLGVPGYNDDAIREILSDQFATANHEWLEWLDAERAQLERRENPLLNSDQSHITALEYNGYIKGKDLLEWGVKKSDIPDEDKLYFSTCWLVNKKVIKAQIALNPKQRPYYYVTSFEKVPGSIHGHGLPTILSDIQDVVNATLRALVNNLAIASGPQVVVDDSVVTPGADSDSLYPWKRWHVTNDPLSPNKKPIDFFQPSSNSQELLSVYKEFTNLADEISAIPRYLTGSQRTGGAASTASGLSMLMNNASKVMQNVAANVDTDLFRPAIEDLYEIVMLTDPGKLKGDEVVVVKGVTNSIKQEQDRVRQLEFLQLTANPIDAQIVGAKGRASVLRAVADNLGLEYEQIIAEDDAVSQQMDAQGAPQGAAPPPAPDGSRSDQATPRMNTVSNNSTM